MKVKLLKPIFLLFFLLQASNLLRLKREKRYILKRKQLNAAESNLFLELRRKKTSNAEIRDEFVELLKESMASSDITLREYPFSAGNYGVIFSAKRIYGIAVKGVYFNSKGTDKALVQSELAVMEQTRNFFFSNKLCAFKEVQNRGYALVMVQAENDLSETAYDYYKDHLKSKNLFDSFRITGFSAYSKTEISEKYYPQFAPKLEQIIQMILGLEEFHRTGLVHTDIKPGNYLVMEDGRIVLADFGLATIALDAYIQGTSGTIGYIPYDTQLAEKKVGEEVKIVSKLYLSQKLDTYALGITILNLIVPQFYRCFYQASCSFSQFKPKIKAYNNKVFQNITKFRAFLNKSVTRKISKVQEDLETIVFEGLLVEREKRFSSSELVEALWEVAPRELILKVKRNYMRNGIECPDLDSPSLKTRVPYNFKVIDYSSAIE